MNDALNTIYSDWISQLKPENESLYFGDDVLVTGVLSVFQESGGLKSLVPHRMMSGSKDYVRLSLEYRGTKHNVDVAQKNGLRQKLGRYDSSEKLFVVEGTINVLKYGDEISRVYKTGDKLLSPIPQELEDYKKILDKQKDEGIKHNKSGFFTAETSLSDLKKTIASVVESEHEILNYIMLLDLELNYDGVLVPMQII